MAGSSWDADVEQSVAGKAIGKRRRRHDLTVQFLGIFPYKAFP
jgi:hypothetical protein